MAEKVAVREFGDEQSTLLDQFERQSFELQLTRAMLGRSLSETRANCSSAAPPQPPVVVAAAAAEVPRGSRGTGFQRVLKKLLSPVLGKKGGRRWLPDCTDPVPVSWNRNTFSRSLRR